MNDPKKPIISGDFHRLKTNGAATAAEVREFLQHIKGRSPEEVLGVIAQSSLMQGVVTATVGCVVLIAGFTVGPYAYSKLFPDVPKAAGAAATSVAAKPQAASQPFVNPSASPAINAAGLPPAPETAGTKAAGKSTPKADEDLLDKLGVGETKLSDPDKNPLAKDKDDLLKIKD